MSASEAPGPQGAEPGVVLQVVQYSSVVQNYLSQFSTRYTCTELVKIVRFSCTELVITVQFRFTELVIKVQYRCTELVIFVQYSCT